MTAFRKTNSTGKVNVLVWLAFLKSLNMTDKSLKKMSRVILEFNLLFTLVRGIWFERNQWLFKNKKV